MGLGLFGGGPSAACSAEATRWWLPVLAGPAPGGAGGWCRLTEPSHLLGGEPRPQGVGQVGGRPADLALLEVARTPDDGHATCSTATSTVCRPPPLALPPRWTNSSGYLASGPADSAASPRGGPAATADHRRRPHNRNPLPRPAFLVDISSVEHTESLWFRRGCGSVIVLFGLPGRRHHTGLGYGQDCADCSTGFADRWQPTPL